jgi:hydroxyacylglutathione hydrolase
LIYTLKAYMLVMIWPLLSDSMESNAYILAGEKTCVIDPGISPNRVLDFNQEYSISTDVLINTHCHFDHVGACPGIIGSGQVSLLMHESGADFMESGVDGMQLAGLFGCEPVRVPVDVRLRDGAIIDLGGVCLEVLHTPGHTPDGICLYEPDSKSLFSGDTLFKGGVGRTDFMGGDAVELRASIQRLLDLSRSRGINVIYPGHGPAASEKDIDYVLKSFF